MEKLSELVARVFAAQRIVKIEHWLTRSRATHDTLTDFYKGSDKALDAVVENFIGMYGPTDFEPADQTEERAKDIAGYLQDEADWIETNRMEISQGSESIGALVDSLVTVYTQTAFLLRMR